jgi:pimeloyl-ACP methyl ester carboxylesterase
MAALVTERLETQVGSIELRRSEDFVAGAGSGEEEGRRRPAVYLHSAQGEGQSLVFLERLAEHQPVVAPVFPGFGDSEGLEHIDDMDDAVFHLLDVWQRLGLDPTPSSPAPVVVGLSLGGWMAVELATRYPEKVGALVLVNPAGLYLRGHEIKDIFGRSPGSLAQDLFYDQDHPVAQMMHALNELTADVGRRIELPFEVVKPVATTLAATAKLGWDPYLHNPKLPKRLWRITCPTLVVRGRDDRLIPPAHCDYYASHIEGATKAEIAEAGHLLAWEKPDELATLITDFQKAMHSAT